MRNPVFIVGAPRSGTTLMLKVLRAHPGFIHVRAEMLGYPSRGRSLASGVFAEYPERLEENCARLQRLMHSNPDQRLVEKTPSHIFYAQDVMERLQNAVFLCMVRDGRDILAFRLRVGRSPDRWFKAPDTVETATQHWLPYAQAIIDITAFSRVIPVRYEHLFADQKNLPQSDPRRASSTVR